MPRLVLRISRRRTSWEGGDVEEIVKTEFKNPDGSSQLEPSVYVLDADCDETLRHDVVRVVAEHTASFLQDPPKGTNSVNLDGIASTHATLGESKFSFANSHHHEVKLSGIGALKDLVRQALATYQQRLHGVDRSELLRYAAAKLAEQDPEWNAALEGREKWLRLIGKHG